MLINAVKCDKCGKRCEADFMTIFHNVKGATVGKGEICPACYGIMHEALVKALGESMFCGVVDGNKEIEEVCKETNNETN